MTEQMNPREGTIRINIHNHHPRHIYYVPCCDTCYETIQPRVAPFSSCIGLAVFCRTTSLVGIMPNATCRCSVPSIPSSTSGGMSHRSFNSRCFSHISNLLKNLCTLASALSKLPPIHPWCPLLASPQMWKRLSAAGRVR